MAADVIPATGGAQLHRVLTITLEVQQRSSSSGSSAAADVARELLALVSATPPAAQLLSQDREVFSALTAARLVQELGLQVVLSPEALGAPAQLPAAAELSSRASGWIPASLLLMLAVVIIVCCLFQQMQVASRHASRHRQLRVSPAELPEEVRSSHCSPDVPPLEEGLARKMQGLGMVPESPRPQDAQPAPRERPETAPGMISTDVEMLRIPMDWNLGVKGPGSLPRPPWRALRRTQSMPGQVQCARRRSTSSDVPLRRPLPSHSFPGTPEPPRTSPPSMTAWESPLTSPPPLMASPPETFAGVLPQSPASAFSSAGSKDYSPVTRLFSERLRIWRR